MHRLLRRKNWLAEVGACLLLAAVVAWLFRYHLLDRATLVGNHDRLHYFLAENLAELNAHQVFGHASAWNDATFVGYDMADLPAVSSEEL
jgi:hypothetical protein